MVVLHKSWCQISQSKFFLNKLQYIKLRTFEYIVINDT